MNDEKFGEERGYGAIPRISENCVPFISRIWCMRGEERLTWEHLYSPLFGANVLLRSPVPRSMDPVQATPPSGLYADSYFSAPESYL